MAPGGIAAIGTEGPVGRRIAAMAGNRPLRQVVEVRTRRRPFSLLVAGEEVAELALDETVITGDGDDRPVRLRRVEVEIVPEWLETPRAAGRSTCRTPAGSGRPRSPKFEAGLLALGLRVPGPPDLGSTEVRRDSSLGDVAYAVMRTQLGALLARESGTRLGDDIEELHEMRVATRRLRAAIDFFADVLPARAKALRNRAHLAGRACWARCATSTCRSSGPTGCASGRRGPTPAPTPSPRPSTTCAPCWSSSAWRRRRELLVALDSARWERLASGLTAMVTHSPEPALPGGAPAGRPWPCPTWSWSATGR